LTSCRGVNVFRKDSLRTDKLPPINQTDNIFKTYSNYTRGIGGEITLSSNGKFEYIYKNCFGGGISSGVFSLKKNEIEFSPYRELRWTYKKMDNKISSDTMEIKDHTKFILIYTEQGLHQKKDSLSYFRVPSYQKE
jgi:hypothetical protein